MPPTRRPIRSAVAALCLLFASLAALAQEPAPTSSPPGPALPPFDQAGSMAKVTHAIALINDGKAGEAIDRDLDPVIDAYAKRYDGGEQTVYSTRWPVEALYYLTLSVTRGGGKAVALDSVWGYALYFKGYALIELHRLAEARAPLRRAVELAPQNSQFLSELAHLDSYERHWDQALVLYRQAVKAAEEFSPPAMKTKELTRAWRGIAYVDIELGDLDEAVAFYERCLALDPTDATARKELGYVRGLQKKTMPSDPGNR